MSRLAGYINKDVMEREDVAMMMSDDSQEIKLFRYTDLDDEDGFRQTSPERKPRYVRSIKGRIDRRDRIYQPQNGEVSKTTDAIYMATVYWKDLRVDDILMVPGQEFRVKFINKIGQSFTEAELEVQV